MAWDPVKNNRYTYKQRNIRRNNIWNARAGDIEKEKKSKESKPPQPGARAIFERDYLDNPKYKSLDEAIDKFLEEQDPNHIYTKENVKGWAEEILAKRKQRDDNNDER